MRRRGMEIVRRVRATAVVWTRAAALLLAPLAVSPSTLVAAAAGDPEAAYLRGLVHERFGRPDDALDFYRRAAALDPSSLFLQRALSDLCLRLGRTGEALAAADRLAALAPKDPAAHLLRGRVYLARGDRASAARAFDDALSVSPANADALIYAAYLSSSSDDPKGAIGFLERYLKENPESPEALSRIAQLRESMGDPAAAEAAWRRALARSPDDPDAHAALGRMAAARDDHAAAAAAYADALALSPGRADLLIPLGDSLYRLGRADEARAALTQAVRADPREAAALYRLAQIARDREEWPEAVDLFRRTLALSDHPELRLELAHAQAMAGRPADALKTLRRLARARPKDPEAAMALGFAYEDLGRRARAARSFDDAARLAPESAQARFRAAVNWDAVGRFDRAEPRLEEAVRLDPRDGTALNYLGFSWADRGKRLDRALDLIRGALALEPGNPAFLDSLGWCLFKMGRAEEGLPHLARAAAEDGEAEVWEHYGDVLAALGRRDAAVRAWEESELAEPGRPSLRRRLGRRPSTFPLADGSLAMDVLKRASAEGAFVRAAAGAVTLTVRRGPFGADAEGVLYYRVPGDFRLEILGAFMAPDLIALKVGKELRVSGVEGGPALPAAAGAWLDALAQALSGAAAADFRKPGAVTVHRRGAVLRYVDAEGASLEIDGHLKRPLSYARDGVILRFEGDLAPEPSAWWPAAIRLESPKDGASLTVRFRAPRINPPLNGSLFRWTEARP